MPEEPGLRAGLPLCVRVSNAFVCLAALLAPGSRRLEWRREWRAEIWHRWQFLRHTGEWNRAEKLRLLQNSLGAFMDAACLSGRLLASLLAPLAAPLAAPSDATRNRVRELARSPFSCLYVLFIPLLLIAALSSGLPATRELFTARSEVPGGSKLFYIVRHPFGSGGDRGLPADVVPAWAKHSRLLQGVAAFNVLRKPVSTSIVRNAEPLLVDTEPGFFDVMGVKPAVGHIPREASAVQGAIVLGHAAWLALTHADPAVLGSKLRIDGKGFGTDYRVVAVLPAGFRFVSRQPTVYLVRRPSSYGQVFVLARVKAGVNERKLDRELTQIAQNVCYYFLKAQLRYEFWNSALLLPLRMFGVAVLVASLIAAAVFRIRPKYLLAVWRPENRAAALRRGLFFMAKTTLALSAVFIGGLEWSRTQSAVLLASRDPGGGPVLLWLYILGAMGVLFWSVADQRARCRVCLRLLAFPVRIGCPGCLLLNWSGTELFCSEGHGVLHIPHLSASWDEASDRWISLDESWRDLFAHEK
jgi:hypothetical protein